MHLSYTQVYDRQVEEFAITTRDLALDRCRPFQIRSVGSVEAQESVLQMGVNGIMTGEEGANEREVFGKGCKFGDTSDFCYDNIEKRRFGIIRGY